MEYRSLTPLVDVLATVNFKAFPKMSLVQQINISNIPEHIAIIMDGNGRWAKSQGLIRAIGHENGTKSVKTAIKTSVKLGVQYLTLYAFSTENWNRPKLEINALMRLLVKSLRSELPLFHEKKVKLNVIGDINSLPDKAKKELESAINETKDYKEMVLTLALSYGGREELVKTFQDIAHKVKNNLISPHLITDAVIKEHLYTKAMPDVDLLIRTSGEQRISNFLLWQIAYAELFFSPVLWPDFTAEHLYEAILNYQQRERRFGKTSEQLT